MKDTKKSKWRRRLAFLKLYPKPARQSWEKYIANMPMSVVLECTQCGSIFPADAFEGDPEEYACLGCVLGGKEADCDEQNHSSTSSRVS